MPGTPLMRHTAKIYPAADVDIHGVPGHEAAAVRAALTPADIRDAGRGVTPIFEQGCKKPPMGWLKLAQIIGKAPRFSSQLSQPGGSAPVLIKQAPSNSPTLPCGKGTPNIRGHSPSVTAAVGTSRKLSLTRYFGTACAGFSACYSPRSGGYDLP